MPERAWMSPRLMHWKNHSDRSVQQEGTCSVVAHLTDTRASRFYTFPAHSLAMDPFLPSDMDLVPTSTLRACGCSPGPSP